MHRRVGAILLLLPALPALAYQDKPPTPAEQYKALLKENDAEVKAFQEAYQKAKTQKEKDQVVKDKLPKPAKLAPKFLELAEKNPKDPVAVDALAWLLTRNVGTGKDSPRSKAVALLLRDHVQSDKLGQVCTGLGNMLDKEASELLQAVLEKNPNKEVQAEACMALAQQISRKAQLVRQLKDQPDLMPRLEQAFGKESAEELQKADAAKLEDESARYYKEFGEKYAASMSAENLVRTCQRLGQMGGAGGEALMRALLEKDQRVEVQGMACLGLAQSLKSRADEMPEDKAQDAQKMRQESEQLFERAAGKYSDVKISGRSTVGEQAKGALFELKYLSVGKEVPEVEGEDADSKKFKLSDYRGKVVLLDFWGHW